MGRGSTSTEQEPVEVGAPERVGEGLLDWRPARLTLIYGLPAVICLLAGSAIYVSRLSVAQDVLLLAQERWVAGGRAAVRLVAYDSSDRPVERFAGRLLLDGEGRESTVVAESGIEGLPALDLDVQVPDWPPGEYRLTADVTTPSGREVFSTPITLVPRSSEDAAPPKLHRPRPPPDRSGPGQSKATLGDVTIELLPRGAGLVPELSNILFMRTTDAEGRPISTEVGLEVVVGSMELPAKRTTDRLGLAVFSVTPRSPDVVIRPTLPGVRDRARATDAGPGADGDAAPRRTATGDGGPSGASDAGADGGLELEQRVQIVVPTTPAQVVMRADHPMPRAGAPLDIDLTSLHSSRPIYVDAYHPSGVWIAGRTGLFQRGRARVRLPAAPPGLLLVQATTAPLQVRYGYAAHHLWLRDDAQDDEGALYAIADELRQRDVDRPWIDAVLDRRLLTGVRRVELTAAFLLSRLDQGYRPPPLRVSSERVQSAELTRFQRSFRTSIVLAISIVGALVTLLLAYAFSVAAWKARRQRQLLEAEVGADEDDLYVTNMGRPAGLDRFRVVLQIVLMVGVVAAGFFLIASLISGLRWVG